MSPIRRLCGNCGPGNRLQGEHHRRIAPFAQGGADPERSGGGPLPGQGSARGHSEAIKRRLRCTTLSGAGGMHARTHYRNSPRVNIGDLDNPQTSGSPGRPPRMSPVYAAGGRFDCGFCCYNDATTIKSGAKVADQRCARLPARHPQGDGSPQPATAGKKPGNHSSSNSCNRYRGLFRWPRPGKRGNPPKVFSPASEAPAVITTKSPRWGS
jgi:hypothetical protein